MSFSIGNRAEISSGMRRSSRASGANPVSRFSSTAQPGKDFAALRYQRQPSTGALVRWQVVQHSILPADASCTDRLQPQDRPQQACFADAVAAANARYLAFCRRQADATQRMARAVVKIDPLDGQHRSAPPIVMSGLY